MEKINLEILKDYYFIDKDGNIFSTKTNKQMKSYSDSKGYLQIELRCKDDTSKSFLIHRLVMKTFNPIENDKNFDINHKNGNKKDNSLDNLEWCTTQYNITHSYINGFQKRKLTDQDVIDIYLALKTENIPVKDISKKYGVSEGMIKHIKAKSKYQRILDKMGF